MTNDTQSPFVLEQLEEALEERQNPDRRKPDPGIGESLDEERRKESRRDSPSKH